MMNRVQHTHNTHINPWWWLVWTCAPDRYSSYDVISPNGTSFHRKIRDWGTGTRRRRKSNLVLEIDRRSSIIIIIIIDTSKKSYYNKREAS